MSKLAIRSLVCVPWVLIHAQAPIRGDYAETFAASADALLQGRLEEAERGLRACLERRPENATCAYYLACVRARSRDPEAALQWLERAAAWGFVDAALVDWDTDLEPLRQSARYSALRARMVPQPADATHRAEILQWPGLNTFPAGSADGTRLLDGIYLWDVASGELVRTLTREPRFNELSWLSPDGRFAVVSQGIDTLSVWDGASGKFLRELRAAHRLWPDGFSGDGSTLLTQRRVWSLETGDLLADLAGPAAGEAGWLSHDGALALTAGEQSAGLYSTVTGALLATFPARPPPTRHRSGGFSADGSRAFLMDGEKGTILVIDVDSRTLLRSVGGPADELWEFVSMRNGATLVTSDGAGRLRWWDLERGEPTLERQALSEASRLRLGPDERFLLEGYGGKIRVWDVQAGAPLWQEELGDDVDDPASRVAFVGDGELCTGWPNRRELRDAATGARTKTLGRKQLGTGLGDMDAQGGTVVVPAGDGTLRVVDVASGRTRMVLEGLQGKALRAVIGKQIVAGLDEHGTLRTWDLQTGEPHARFEIPCVPLHGTAPAWSAGDLTFSPDDERLLLWGSPFREDWPTKPPWGGVWNARTGELMGRLPLAENQRFEHCAWSPDGSKIATLASDGKLRLCNGVSGAETGPELVHPERVTAVAFHPDNRHLATGCADTRARLWDLDARELIRELAHHHEIIFDEPQVVSGLAFNADGSRLVTTVTDWGEIACWEVETGRRLWLSAGMDGQEGGRIEAFFDAAGERIVYMPLFESLVVVTETGQELSDLSASGGWPLQPFGPEYLALSGDGLAVLDAASLELRYTRLEFPDGERLLHVPALYCDGSAEALRNTRLFLDGEDYPLDSFAAVLLDPKRVRAAIQEVELAPPRLAVPPEVELLLAARRWTTAEDAVVVEARASDPLGLLAIEIEQDGRAVLPEHTELAKGAMRMHVRLRVERASSPPETTLTLRAVGRSGLVSRPVRQTLVFAPR